MSTTIMEVSIKSFNNNINEIKKYVSNKKIIPVIKANAYGTYINKRLDVINNFDIVAVAKVSEAIELREIGYEKEIFLLNQPSILEIEDILKNDVTVGLSSLEFLNIVVEENFKIKIHLEIETGMNRTGIKIQDINKFVDILKNNHNVHVDGVYTHFSSADLDQDYTNKQIELFKEAVNIIKNNFSLTYIHSSASNGLLNYDDGVSNAVRPGIIMYGYESFNGVNKLINLEPVCKLKTIITFLKELNENESISYGRSFISSKRMTIATIPIGYADGLRRSLSNKGFVVINGKKCPIVGKICMDSAMVDVSEVNDVKLGDEVFIFDNNMITLDDIANLSDTINYEILSNISNRVPRIFIDE